MIIDSHCHLDYPNLYDQLDKVMLRAEKNNVHRLLTICTNMESYEKIKLIVKRFKSIYGTFGIHPHETKKFPDIKKSFIVNAVNNENKIIGIGETGLDFYYNHSDVKIQKDSFINHIQAASELNIPVIVHSRNAEVETYEILKSELKNSRVKVLIHCFTGSSEFAKKLLDINCYISVSGIITFKNSLELVTTVSSIPLDQLLVETDSPYLAPSPLRGSSNEPSFIIHTVEKLSKIKKVSIDIISSKTTENFKKLFNMNINES